MTWTLTHPAKFFPPIKGYLYTCSERSEAPLAPSCSTFETLLGIWL